MGLFIEDTTEDRDLEALDADRDARCRHRVRVDLEECRTCEIDDDARWKRGQDR